MIRTVVVCALSALAWGCERPGAVREDAAPRAEIPVRPVKALGVPGNEWAFDVPGDLRLADGVSFDFRAGDLAAFEKFKFSFRSGKGRYFAHFDPGKAGRWNRVTVLKSDCFLSEGEVAGWGDVKTLTIAGHIGDDPVPPFRIADVRLVSRRPEILVVRGDSALAKFRGDCHDRLAATMTKFLVDMGAPAVEVSDLEVDRGIPDTVKLVVLPSNPALPERALAVIKGFAEKGGRLVSCYNVDPGIRRIEGVRLKRCYDRRRVAGVLPIGGMAACDGRLAGQPDFVPGRLNSLFEIADAKIRPLASFSDTARADTGLPALVRTKNGFYFTSLWEFWGAGARALMRSVLASCDPGWKNALADGERRAAAEDARVRDWLRSLKPKAGEMRGVSCHAASGLPGKTWNETVALVKAGGFNFIAPNVAWANTIFKKEARECLDACRAHGIECSFWKVCWRRRRGSDEPYPGRAMKDFSGKVDASWMCPSDPLNRKAEQEQFLELARMKPDRIEFDYIRYPNGFTCACDGCREKFERIAGLKITDWKRQVHKNKDVWQKWLEFRRDVITSFVRETAALIRAECPGVKLVASVSPHVDVSRNWRGLDWVEWCREGLLDYVQPMNYYFGNEAALRELLKRQAEVNRLGRTRVLPLIGLYEWPQLGRDSERMAKEMLLVREYGFDGFGVFQLVDRMLDVFPELRSGITAEDVK